MSVFDFRAHPSLPRPRVTVAEAREVVREHYGISSSVVELGSNQDRNFRLDGDGRRFLLKFSNSAFGAAELRAQNLAAAAVAAAGIPAPRVVPVRDGAELIEVELDGETLLVRLLEYVEGDALSDHGPFSADEARRLGTVAGRVASALDGLTHPGLEQRTQWNLRDAPEVVRLLAGSIPDRERRHRVLDVTAAAERALAPLVDGLRTQAVHGDLTDDNLVVVPGSRDWGVIDFGDVATSWTVAELAVTCAAILHHNSRDPLVVLDTVAGFHGVVPLRDAEIAALWPLVLLRAATLVASGEHQVSLEADNDYAAQNRRHEWRSFAVAASLDPSTMETLLRHRLTDGRPLTLTGTLVDASAATSLDLSTTSPFLDGGAWLDSGIEARLSGAHAPSVTVWGSARLTRARVRGSRGTATIPLGIELTVADSTPVTAPATGTVRRSDGALVLQTADYDLWLEGLVGIPADLAGDIPAGALLGRVAAGGRLAVQLSRVRGARLPFFVPPVVASAARQVSPDPSPLLRRASTDDDIAATELLARRDAHFARVQEHYFAAPPRIERGWREHFVDTDGQAYLDMVNNVATVGHAHPRLVGAVARQWALHNTNSRFHYAAVAEFSARLSHLAPPGLEAVFLVNSGSEAVDLAIRLATTATGRDTIVAMREAYHGWTVGSDAVSSSIGDNPRALETRPSWVRLVDAPNTYRGTHRGPDAGTRYLADLEADLRRWDAEGVRIAGFLAEPVYGNAGGVFLPDGYLEGVYRAIRERGGLCIADEVQVGYGRLGEYFWGHEQQGVTPDILTIAKAMGNGHPLGAVLTTRAIAEAFAAEGSMFSSAGGSPVSCVVGSTVLDIMRDEGLVENARVVGERLRAGLDDLGRRHAIIGAVHGVGLYLGVELVRSRDTLEPATVEAEEICEAMLDEGCIVQPTGDHRNILKIKPPLVIEEASVDYFVAALDRVLAARTG